MTSRYGIDLLFSQGKIEWDGMEMPMRSPEDLLSKEPTTYEKKLAARENMPEDDDLAAATDLDMTDDEFEDDYGDSEVADAPEEHFAQHIADAQHAKANLESIARSQKQLNSFQQDELLEVLKKFEDLFQGNLGAWPDTEIGATLVGGATPWLHFPFSHSFAGGSPKGEGKSNVLGIPLFLFLFPFLAFLLEVPKGTLNLRKIEGKGKAS